MKVRELNEIKNSQNINIKYYFIHESIKNK